MNRNVRDVLSRTKMNLFVSFLVFLLFIVYYLLLLFFITIYSPNVNLWTIRKIDYLKLFLTTFSGKTKWSLFSDVCSNGLDALYISLLRGRLALYLILVLYIHVAMLHFPFSHFPFSFLKILEAHSIILAKWRTCQIAGSTSIFVCQYYIKIPFLLLKRFFFLTGRWILYHTGL